MSCRSSPLYVCLIALAVFAGGWRAHARTTSASTTNADGTTTTITKNPDGTTTRTVTDANGQIVSSGPIQPEPVTKAAPRPAGTSASTTNPDGTTTTITKNPDGTTTRTVTDANGQIVSSGPMQPEPVTKVPPRTPGTSASTTNTDGTTTTITKNPDGTTTRTVTGPNGQVLSSGPVTPEPATKVPPRTPGTSASTTNPDGTTTTITKNPDGTRTRTVTDATGKILKTETLGSGSAQMLYNSVKKDDCTLNSAMVLTSEPSRTLLEVSLLATGKGTSFRSWVPEKTSLVLGGTKLKPIASKPYYVEKESIVARAAAVLFAVIGAQYAAEADKAQASEGKPCPITGKPQTEHRERGKVARTIDEAGMAAGMGLLASQAKGQIEGRHFTFDVTGQEDKLPAASLLVRAQNTQIQQLNIANDSREREFKVPVNFQIQR